MMNNKLHQVCDWEGDGNRYMVVGIYVNPYYKGVYLTLVPTILDTETGVYEGGMAYPSVMALESELTFIGELNE